jgi:hypothetical protein
MLQRQNSFDNRISGAVMSLALSWMALTLAFCSNAPPSSEQPEQTAQAEQKTFTTPEAAVDTLIKTAKKGDVETDDVVSIFGRDGRELIDTADPTTARHNREVFAVAAAERWRLVDAEGTTGRKTLVVGNEDWPFPVPLVKEPNGWRFDTAAGKQEVIDRRIGQNELAVIDICKRYVAAQQAYAREGHDGKPAGLYARAFQSDPGRHNGLYWPAAPGEKRSPIGDLVTHAALEGRKAGAKPAPFQGYYFKILTAQGADSPGGAKDYLVNGEMAGGFALVAWPAKYDVTGIMTFTVNHDGVVHQKDLGPGSDTTAAGMKTYNPDQSWETVQ